MNKVNNRFGGRPKTSFILNLNHVDNTIEELSDVIDPNKNELRIHTQSRRNRVPYLILKNTSDMVPKIGQNLYCIGYSI